MRTAEIGGGTRKYSDKYVDGSHGAAGSPSMASETAPEVELLVGRMIDEAQAFVATQVRPFHSEASDLYHARPLGNEEEGRSRVVISVIRDAVRNIMPSLMRIFASGQRYAEFRARPSDPQLAAKAEALADQATDYINLIVMEDNPGFQIIHDVLKDMLVRRTGVVKWWAESALSPETSVFTGLSEQDLMVLLLDPKIDLKDFEQEDEDEGALPNAAPTYKATVSRRGNVKRIRLRSCPGEEIAWNRDARDFESASIVVHTRHQMPGYELVNLGYDWDEIEPFAGPMRLTFTDAAAQEESDARRQDAGNLRTEEAKADKTRFVRYDEAYVYLNYEDEGVKLYRVCCIGEKHHMLGEPIPVSHRPFALFTYDPEPHTLEGGSVTDDLKTTQRVQSMLARGVLDSLALTLEPATEVVDGAVNIRDLMEPEIGRIVRVTQPNMMREVAHTFVGEPALAVMQYFDEVKENATGQSKASLGLGARSMQSTTKDAVTGTFQVSQQRIELIARMAGETGFKPMFKGLLRTTIENQDQPRVVKLRGKYVSINPRAWDADLDVEINVALGAGSMEDRIQTLKEVYADQKEILATLGPGNPLVKMSNLRATAAEILTLSGYRNAAKFYQEIDPEQEAAAEKAAAQAPPQQPQDPAAVAAQAALQKAELEAQVERERMEMEDKFRTAELQLKAKQLDDEAQDAQEKRAVETSLAIYELEIKHGTAIDKEKIKALIAENRGRIDAHAKITAAEIMADSHRAGHAAGVTKAEIAADSAHRVATVGAAAKIATAPTTAEPQTPVAAAIRKAEARQMAADITHGATGAGSEAE